MLRLCFLQPCLVEATHLGAEEITLVNPIPEFISFPKDLDKREGWLQAMQNDIQTLRALKDINVCENQFRTSCDRVKVQGGKKPSEPLSVFPGLPKSALKQVTCEKRPTLYSSSEARATKAKEIYDNIRTKLGISQIFLQKLDRIVTASNEFF